MSSTLWSLYRFQVTAEADPGALARVIERFHHLNILPRKVLAEVSSRGTVHIQLEVTGLPEEMVSLIAGKIGQVPSILDVRWQRP